MVQGFCIYSRETLSVCIFHTLSRALSLSLPLSLPHTHTHNHLLISLPPFPLKRRGGREGGRLLKGAKTRVPLPFPPPLSLSTLIAGGSGATALALHTVHCRGKCLHELVLRGDPVPF